MTDRRSWECHRCLKVNGPHVDQCECQGWEKHFEGVVQPFNPGPTIPGHEPTTSEPQWV